MCGLLHPCLPSPLGCTEWLFRPLIHPCFPRAALPHGCSLFHCSISEVRGSRPCTWARCQHWCPCATAWQAALAPCASCRVGFAQCLPFPELPPRLERGGIPLGVSLHAAGLRQGMPCAVLQPCSCQHEGSVSQASGPGCTRGWSWPGCAAGKWLWLGTQTRLLPGLGAAIPNGSTRDRSAITVTGQTDSTWGKLIYSQLK